MTREEWLIRGVDALRPRFADVGAELPPIVHVSFGFPSRAGLARTKRRVGECWSAEASQDGNCHVFVSPVHTSPVESLDTLAHELVHVVTPGAGHAGKFISVSRAIGLTKGKPTSAGAGDELRAELERIALELGALPHSTLTYAGHVKKQSTRLVKCECEGCGYTVRVTRKWLEIGAPICPACSVEMNPNL